MLCPVTRSGNILHNYSIITQPAQVIQSTTLFRFPVLLILVFVCLYYILYNFYHLCRFLYPLSIVKTLTVPTPQGPLILPFYNHTYHPPDDSTHP